MLILNYCYKRLVLSSVKPNSGSRFQLQIRVEL